MRYIVDYPVTYDEAIDFLDRAKENLNPELIGDPSSVVIDWIKNRLDEHKKLESFYEDMKNKRDIFTR